MKLHHDVRGTRTEVRRRGAIAAMSVATLVLTIGFVGFVVDIGMINVVKSRMQAAADAAALASAQEIVLAISEYAAEQTEFNLAAATQASADAARQMADDVVSLNGMHIDPDSDVRLGKRIYDPASDTYEIRWGESPYNLVQITILKDNPDVSAPDGRLELFFSPLYGDRTTALKTTATAFVNARDIVAVLDYSGSMNFDSLPINETLNRLPWASVEDNLNTIWAELVGSDARFSNSPQVAKFPASGFGKINSAVGTRVTSTSVNSVFASLDLDENHLYATNLRLPDDVFARRRGRGGRRSGNPTPPSAPTPDPEPAENELSYAPFPQEGKSGSGSLLGLPSEARSRDLWEGYIDWVIDHSTSNNHWDRVKLLGNGYDLRYQYGYQTLVMYLLVNRRENDESEDLWRVSAYPFKAVKVGMGLFSEFLEELSFGDYLGLVTYGTTSQVETGLDQSGVETAVDLGNTHLTRDYAAINTIQQHKQAAHYSGATNIGDGMSDARNLLEEQGIMRHRPTILLMTDGAVNRPSSVPGYAKQYSFNWDKLTDWDGDGSADYTNADVYAHNAEGYYPDQKKWVLYQAKMAADDGVTIHTISVGQGADQDLMRAVANIAGGEWLHVEGQTTEDLQFELNQTFRVMGGLVPPATLVANEE